MSYFLVMSKEHGDGVLSQYQRLRSQGLLCDLVLVAADGTQFPAHRSLLACSGDYFWSMFKEHTYEFRAQRVELPAISSKGLESILDFIYTSWLSLSICTLEDTLEAANYLQVTRAVDLCVKYMRDNLSVDNCCFFANVAARYGVDDALAAANSFIGCHMGELLGPGGDRVGLLELNLDSLRCALEVDEMSGVDELPLLLFLLDWLGSNSVSAVKSNLVLSKIRFGLVPPGPLSWLSSTQPALQTPFIQNLVLKALNYHSQGARQPLLQNNQTSLRSRTCQVLLVGGTSAAERLDTRVQVFYPERRKFQHLTDLPSRVQHHCACTVGNFLFVLGGEVVKLSEDEKVLSAASSNQVWRYDPRFRCWEVASPMTERRVQFSCCVSQGNIYAIGGRRGKGASLDSVEMYDLRANRWLRAAALPCAMFAQACVSYKGAVYLSGGVHAEQRVSSNEVYRLEPQEGRWTKCAAMGIARSGHQMAVLQDNIYAFLGMYEPFCDIERYDPALDQWTRLRPLLSDRFCYGLVQLESTALLVGGRKWHSGREVATPNVLEYEPESDSWREVCKLPKPLSGTQCALMQLPTPLDL
ncbi:kelch-like protein 34-like [Scleropages formosus]|uniref:Kelch-like protein 34-like n=1 Tax=Scleropages formosus TaxID=113540 RepID=A0A0N8JVY1_SCLFO|nr:kelch-like protein 34 [Scleropages formosus]KPP59401.1 kelch-like protein 34-like [Scleropages formosus]